MLRSLKLLVCFSVTRILSLGILSLLLYLGMSCNGSNSEPVVHKTIPSTDELSDYLEYASKKLLQYSPPRKDYVIVIDYRKKISEERLYLLDMQKQNAVLVSKVAHAWRSGESKPTQYSNEFNSLKSSKGNYVTASTYTGTFGYSMNVKGLDTGVNDNAYVRRIIFHSDKKMNSKWSWGCFATPEEINKTLIDLTKNGVLVCVID